MADPDKIARVLLRGVNRAVRQYGLIADGDRIAVGVSGGKDSRTLLDLLVRGVDLPGEYEVVAVHVDGAAAGLPDQKPQLESWFQALGTPYHIVPLAILDDEPLPMDCFRCAWNRRKTLFLAADELGCTTIAYGHHADDAAVTTLLSLMYKGQLETLAPRLSFFDGRFSVIRPLVLLSEAEIRRYARACGWTFPSELVCPREDEARRAKVEAFLAQLPARERKQIRANLWRAARANGEEGPTR
jgi:tRNA(Ile)-lysidine synthase TilS/MesJ